jgi:hypothetical protein
MNLAAVANGAITTINPNTTVVVSISTGYTKNADFRRTPTYINYTFQAQIQPLTGRDLRQVEGLNLQGTLRAIYLYGDIEGVIRYLEKGGDIITDELNRQWLVNQVLETWADWCKVVVTLQNSKGASS